MSVMLAALLAGLVAGAASAPHCLGMCGPLAALAALPTRGRTNGGGAWRALRWQVGRLSSYAALGGIAGAIGAEAIARAAPSWAPAWGGAALSIALAIALAINAVRLWAPRTPKVADVAPERLARGPRAPSLAARVMARAPREPALLGAITALLPCGALWSGVVIAAGAGSLAAGALAMLGFAAASGGALAFAGAIGARAQGSVSFRRSLAAVLAVGALITVLRPLPTLRAAAAGEAPATCHSH